MGVTSVQGFKFKLVANGEILDLFADEEIKISDNITGLFDLGVLPADFTKTMTLPGSKKNNHFFEFVWDISVENPYTFATNLKVPCYMDFDGIYLTDGYIQLNKVNLYQNKFVDSYEVTIYGGLASFGRDLKRYFLTDLTGSLAKYNHTFNYENISASWSGNLLNGSIVYPMAEYGEKITYLNTQGTYGISNPSGSLCVQDFKPAIRMLDVWDAVFEEFGFTYTSSFLSEPWLQNVYMLANNKLRYPIFSGSIDLETYGQFKIGPISGSGTDTVMTVGTALPLPWFNIQSNPGGNLSDTLVYGLGINSVLRGAINLNFQVSASAAASASGQPQFNLILKNTGGTTVSTTPLTYINDYLKDIQIYNAGKTKTQTFNLYSEFQTSLIPSGSYNFYLEYDVYGYDNFTVTLAPNSNTESYLSMLKVNQAGEGLTMVMANNMPQGPGDTSAGTNGIKLIDFITSVQKKFNLVIYPNKLKLNEFIVEPFNRWYKEGSIKNFNSYINLNDIITATPANNLAVQNLSFGDTLDGDYVSQQFAKAASREYGRANYIDTENFYSQGNFEVKTGFASSPLVYLAGTGTSGSTLTNRAGFQANANATTDNLDNDAFANATIDIGGVNIVNASVTAYAPGPRTAGTSDPLPGPYRYGQVSNGSVINWNGSAGSDSATYSFVKIDDLGTHTLSTGSAFTYVITPTDITSTVLNFIGTSNGTTNY